MLEDSGAIGSSGMQHSAIEIMFPVLDSMFQTVPGQGGGLSGDAASRGRPSLSTSRDEELCVEFEIFDTQGSVGSRQRSSAGGSTQHMAGMSTTPAGALDREREKISAADATPAAAAAAAAATDEVLGALASAVDADLPHLAGIGAGPAQAHVSLFCTRAHAADSSSGPPAVMVHISPAALPTAAEVALAAPDAAAWAAAPDIPDLFAAAFEPETFQTPECMLGVRKALGDALRSARGSASSLHTVWRGAAAKLRPEALSVVTSKHVSPQMLQSCDSGAPHHPPTAACVI